jgi:hypothetical protein
VFPNIEFNVYGLFDSVSDGEKPFKISTVEASTTLYLIHRRQNLQCGATTRFAWKEQLAHNRVSGRRGLGPSMMGD